MKQKPQPRAIRSIAVGLLSLVVCGLGESAAAPQAVLPGYSLELISGAVPSGTITQLAFDPADDEHLYAVTAAGSVLRYDYDSATGSLSNALTVADGLGLALGLAFHDGDLYVSGSLVNRHGDDRIARLSAPDVDGVYQIRHDFVHGIPAGGHNANQLQIVGDSLYVGIGAVGRRGDPNQENIYTMTLARIADLTAIDFSGPLDAEFRGPTNYLADEAEWIDTSAADGKLRYHASGFRNPYGIAVDFDGDVWVSSNGNSDPGFSSLDYLYKKVPLGGQGLFPPEAFGFGDPYIIGNPIVPLSNLGQNPSPTGFDFVPAGPDQGKVVLAQAGASDQVLYPVGKDVLLVDPSTGAFDILVDDLDLPTDVVRDPFGRLLIADFGDDSIWLLTPPTGSPAGRLPGGRGVPGPPLRIDKATDEIVLTWSASCLSSDSDFVIYEGTLGSFYDHQSRLCSTDGQTTAMLAPQASSAYYLVFPSNGAYEGSPGRSSNNAERPIGAEACLPRSITTTCP